MKIGVASLLALALTATTPSASVAATTYFYSSIGATSAYARDWAQGADFTNYAFDSSTSTFVGSWRVDQGFRWNTAPVAYSGQTAAALLFGGSPDDYFISTIDADANHADRLAWVTTYGGSCATFAHCGIRVDQAYIAPVDAAGGNTFSIPGVPEPATWTLMIAGFGLVGMSARRRRRLASA